MLQFQWPAMLWTALVLPALVVAYLWLLRRRKRIVVDYPGLSLVRQAAGGPDWRRRVPPVLLLAALGSLVLAGGRPTATITLPTDARTIVLAIDVSGSMMATDVKPNRLQAAQAAAKAFVSSLPRGVRVGLVAYGGTAQLVQPPTDNRGDVTAAIDRFQLQPGTAIGSGLALALMALFPNDRLELFPAASMAHRRSPVHASATGDEELGGPGPARAPVRAQPSAAIVLLSDGANTSGPDPLDMAQQAAERGVQVHTVGFGTREGATIDYQGWSQRVTLDEQTLKTMARMTGGQYFHAGSGQDLSQAYARLKSRLVMEKRDTEITVLFALLAGALVLAAGGLSTWWFGRIA